MANEIVTSLSDHCQEHTTFGYSNTSSCAVGNGQFVSGSQVKGGMRFTNISLNQGSSVSFAGIYYEYSGSNNVSSGNWKHYLYGIDEDNTGDFGSNPFGRSHTSARITTDDGGGGPQYPGSKLFDVTSIVQEIVNRSGCSSGNAIGFLFENNGSSTDVYASASSTNSYFVYRQSAEPNFYPTPLSVSAPTIPSGSTHGIKISIPGVEVLTATESQLSYTSDKNVLKIKEFGSYTLTSASDTLIVNHNLGYKPFVLVYLRYYNGSTWVNYKLPTGFGVNSSTVLVTDSQLKIQPNTATNDVIYYYIFIDPQYQPEVLHSTDSYLIT